MRSATGTKEHPCALSRPAFPRIDVRALRGLRIGRKFQDRMRSRWLSVIGGHPLGDTKMDGYPGASPLAYRMSKISTLPGTREASSWSSSRHQAIHPYRVLWLYKHSAPQGCSPTGWCSRRQAQELHRSRPTSRSETGIIGKDFSIRYSCRYAQGAPHDAGAPVGGGSKSWFCAFWHSLPSTLP